MVNNKPETYPDLTVGPGSVETLPGLVEDGAWGTVLLVCGKQSFEQSGAVRVLDQLSRVASVHRWSEFEPNTSAGDLNTGLKTLRDVDPDVVIAIGGGSAMDLAKLMCGFDGLTDRPSLESAIKSGQQLANRRRALILAPTTSGTGSEATHFSTVYVEQEKFSVSGEGLRPDVVILDPELTLSASAYQKAASGLDAVAQAIESLWAVAATPSSRRFARRALRYLMPNIEPFVHGAQIDHATAMALGSHLAGRAIDISRTTASHALSYALTQKYGVSHGHAVALTLGAFVAAHATPTPGRLRPGVDPALHARVMDEILGYLAADTGTGGARQLRGLMNRVNLPVDLSDVGVATSEDREAIAASVNPERLGNNPVLFDHDRLRALLDECG